MTVYLSVKDLGQGRSYGLGLSFSHLHETWTRNVTSLDMELGFCFPSEQSA